MVFLSFILVCHIPSTKARRCNCNLSSRRCQIACGTVSGDTGLYVFPFKRNGALLTRLTELEPDDMSGVPNVYETEPRTALRNEDDENLMKYYSWLLEERYGQKR